MKKLNVKSVTITLSNDEVYEFLLHKCKKPEIGYVVTSPKNNGLLTQGDTIEETLSMIVDALSCWRDIKIV
jgi:predicted RNase H-like HicB family nuclease